MNERAALQRAAVVDSLAIAASFAVALALRAVPGWRHVFQADSVVFQGVDAWFHMRLAENLAKNFPHRLGLDPYGLIPGGQNVNTGPLLDYLIAGAAWVIGLGSPSEATIDTIGAVAPPILGALITIPVFWMARTLFGRLAAWVAASLVAVLPGVFLSYSLLGMTDHHITESLFFVSALASLLHGLRAQTTRDRRRATVWLSLSLACVALNRPGAFFVMPVFALWAVLQIALDIVRQRGITPAAGLLAPAYATALLVFVPLHRLVWAELMIASLLGSMALVGAAHGLAQWSRRRGAHPAAWWAGMALIATVGAGIVYLAAPARAAQVWSYATGLLGPGNAQTVGELRPLFLLTGSFRWMAGFVQFALAGPIAAGALAWLLWSNRRGEDAARLAFALVAALIAAAALAQNRNAVYLAPCVAVLAAWPTACAIQATPGRRKVLAGAVATLLVYLPNALYSAGGARIQRGPSLEWRSALTWMRQATPEPLGDPDAYFRHFPRPAEGTSFEHPPGAYGVMNWWDSGYWVGKIARRIPTANGTQAGAEMAARFYASRDPEEAAELLRQNRARYILVDSQLPILGINQIGGQNSRFLAMTVWADLDIKDFIEVYVQSHGNDVMRPLLVFYPAYYQSMLARLQLFGGKAVEPQSSTYVFSYREMTSDSGEPYKALQSQLKFATYEQAREYVDERPGQTLAIGGLDPTRTCVPLDALKEFELSYESSAQSAGGSAVRVFELLGARRDGGVE